MASCPYGQICDTPEDHKMIFIIIALLFSNLKRLSCSSVDPFAKIQVIALKHNEDPEQRAEILKSIVVESLSTPFSYNAAINNSRFDDLSKFMGKHLNKTAEDQKLELFQVLLDHVKAQCLKARLETTRGDITFEKKSFIGQLVTILVCEAIPLSKTTIKFSFPESFTIFILQTIKPFGGMDSLATIAMGLSEYCETNECMDLVHSIVVEAIEEERETITSASTGVQLKETESYDKLVRNLLNYNRSGKSHLCTIKSLVGTILRGPPTREAALILAEAVDESVLKAIYESQRSDVSHLSRILSRTETLEHFLQTISTFDYTGIGSLKEILSKNNRIYRQILKIKGFNFLAASMEQLEELIIFMHANQKSICGFYRIDYMFYNEFIEEINGKVSSIFSLMQAVRSNHYKLKLIRTTIALLHLIPNWASSINFTQYNYEPILDFVLAHNVEGQDLSEILPFISLKKTIDIPTAIITKQTLRKLVDIYKKWFPDQSTKLLKETLSFSVISKSFDHDDQISKFKMTHQLYEECGLDFSEMGNYLISQLIRKFDLHHAKELVSYAKSNALLSTTVSLILDKYVKNIDDSIN